MTKNDLHNLVKDTVNETLLNFFKNEDFVSQMSEDVAFGKILQEKDLKSTVGEKDELVSEEEVFAELRK